MDFLFEIILQFLGELLLQLFVELLLELGFHSMANTFERPRNPTLSAIGYVLWGAIAGGLSLLLFPNSFVHNHALKIANLFITPIVLGVCMMLVGKYRSKKDKPLIRLDSFAYGFLFAFSMSLVRYVWAA
jgi:hypothetical protein